MRLNGGGVLDWKDLNVSSVVCYCENVTKKEIIMAINQGARTVDDIREKTGACAGKRCRLTNPRGICCRGDVEEMIAYYAPLADALGRQA